MTKKIIIIFILLISMTSFSQEKSSFVVLKDSIGKLIRERKVPETLILLKNINKKDYSPNQKYELLDKNYFYCYYITKDFDSCFYFLNKTLTYHSSLNLDNQNNYFLNKAYYFKEVNLLDSSVYYYTKALKHFELDSSKNSRSKSTIYNGLARIYRLTSNKKKQLFYLEKYLYESKKTNNSYRIGAALNNLGVYYDNLNEPKKAIKNFKKSLNYKQRIKSRNTTLQNIGSIYLNHFNNLDSSSYYNKKAINKYTSKRTLAFIHKDLAIIEKRKGNFLLENKELQTSLNNIKQDPFLELELKLYKELAENNNKLKRYKKANYFLDKYIKLNDSIKNQKQFEALEDIETKYETAKKEKENLQLKQDNLVSEQKRKQNRNLLYGSLVLLSLGGVIGYQSLKNSRRKRLLSEQQEELEKQKNITLIKEQEITTINAMIDGQEKERIRIAEDLHDNIGSVLATLKLHFENLKLNREKKHFNQEELYEKTEGLIDETYKKVRSIAHAKNAGVIANKGLLVAVKIIAEKISSANKTQIEVIDFGLHNRLENTLEITVFRIIQELLTNIIKHSQADNATVNISQFKNTLQIIIEDDGVGFDYKMTPLKSGMGLSSIKTRIEHLKGTFSIDATINKGTNIIISIPIE